MREADKSYLWCTEAWFRTKPGTTPSILCIHLGGGLELRSDT